MTKKPPSRRRKPSDLPRGVFRNGSGFTARILIGTQRVSLGTYDTPEEASQRYEETRELLREEPGQ